ncbi:MAG: UDP-N-acetylglucosamine--N-acetylmuramyl-(pentapeptide) pyrophosphoryl-undecaprenol N-acetylglucosamine transferase [Methanobacterium sp.]|nr:UDP-N-acetylglucosamine--N-acetylmuramyl-(pentapeptide) pyrophosphoryl-undecaprenol N-acetylglucosamine transferase [Methanobacterium sp.]
MKVLMMPCGIGMGHVSRCIALANKLKENGVEVAFASYGSGYETLVEAGVYKTVKLPDIKFYGNGGELDIKHTAKKSIDAPFILLKSIYHESKIIKKFKPDVVVADSHYSVPITCKVLGIPCIMITNELTLNFSELYPDEKTIEYLENGLKRFITDVSGLCNAILIPDIKDSIEIPLKLEDIALFTGPILKNNPDEIADKTEIRKKFGLNKEDKIILITVGGSEFGKKLLKLIYEASDSIESDKIIIVTGPQIKSDFIQNSDKIIKKKFLDNMMEWMNISDLVISLAGHTTTMELASLGIPNILVPIDNHPEQAKNALNMEKYGISIVNNLKELNPADFAANINSALNNEKLKRNAEIVKRKFSKYNGTENTIKIISEYAGLHKNIYN